MPYIPQDARERVFFCAETYPDPQNAGELNYMLTVFVHDYWDRMGKNYQAFNDIIGALEGCKLELYRRRVAPYEDLKREANGDVT